MVNGSPNEKIRLYYLDNTVITDETGNFIQNNSTQTNVLFAYEGMTEEAAAAAENSADGAVFTIFLGTAMNILFGGLL